MSALGKSLLAASAVVLLAAGVPSATAQPPASASGPARTTVNPAVRHDVSAPLRRMARTADNRAATGSPDVVVNKPNPQDRINAQLASDPGPAVIPDPTGPLPGEEMPSVTAGFPGIDNAGPSYPAGMGYYPPDPDGAIGPNHYVHMVNAVFAVFDRSGNELLSATPINTVFAGFGGDCEATNNGDPIVQYDQYADRWLLTQFSYTGGGYYECVAVSSTPDPLGSYARYAFEYNYLPDYPKLGVWPDGYYASYNMFEPIGGGNYTFRGTTNCAFERSRMLAGEQARQICFDAGEEFSLLPSDADGTTPPPAGAPNYFVAEHWSDNDKLTMYKFHVDWDTPANSTFAGPVALTVNPFTWACVTVNRGRCVPQPSTGVRLESLGSRVMYRAAYRNYGDHQSLLLNHTVAMDSNMGYTAQTGIGWYELRDLDAATPTVHQQGTSADPDNTTFRFMGSMAADKQGNMALGYSASSSSLYPGIQYVGRLVDDPLNTMPQAKGVIKSGSGSQTGGEARWGDYTAMSVDPLDDCTFWYVNEYMKATSQRDWSTWIANFKYPGCTGSASLPSAPDDVAAVPGSQRVELDWTPPADSGGLPVVGYEVSASPGGRTCTTRVGVDADPLACTFDGLTDGVEYTFSVRARNALGLGPQHSITATPQSRPDAPREVTAWALNSTEAGVQWLPPVHDGSSQVSGYTVTAEPGGATCTAAVDSCLVRGLTPGASYTFTAVATNSVGSSRPSAPSAVLTMPKLEQTAAFSVPAKIKSKGRTVLLKSRVVTNAGSVATVKVTRKPAKKKYSKLITKPSGRVILRTFGKKKIKVTLSVTAPETAEYTAYSYTKKWTVKRS